MPGFTATFHLVATDPFESDKYLQIDKKSLFKMNRVNWIDVFRGVIILFLVGVHYIGALEERGILSEQVVDTFKVIFGVARPGFVFIFGLVLGICYLGENKYPLSKIFFQGLRRVPELILAREVIVCISAVRHDYEVEKLIRVLTYQEFSQHGEILTFFALACATSFMFICWIKNRGVAEVFFFSSIAYIISIVYATSVDTESLNRFVLLLIYDPYAYFSYMYIAIIGMILGWAIVNNKLNYARSSIATVLMMGFSYLYIGYFYESPIKAIADGVVTVPPLPEYIIFYIGFSIGLVLLLKNIKWKVLDFAALLGRHSLLCYVLHYLLFVVPLLAAYIPFTKGSTSEVIAFILFSVFLISIVVGLEKFKKRYSV